MIFICIIDELCAKFRENVFSDSIIPMHGERPLTERALGIGWAYGDKITNIALCVPRLRKSLWWELLNIQRQT
jgi:hypothetical protein